MNVELRDIHKRFGKVHANDGISLNIKSGSIQGILGENGAGKSTLMKILSGFIQADSGDIFLDGKKTIIHSPADAVRLGIGMLHQDPLDVPAMRAIDNFILGSPSGFFPNINKATSEFKKLQKQYGFDIHPDAYVESMTVGERQQLEILRLLWLGARVLILDEPTTGISAAQKSGLFETVYKLAKQDKAIIFVSHKLEEVEQLCSQVAVFSQGKKVGESKPPYKTDELVRMMFGKIIKKSERSCQQRDDIFMQVKNMDIEDVRLKIRDVGIDIRCGEVIGLAGMEGSGQSLILKALAGLIRPTNGKIIIKSQNNKEKDLVGKHYFDFKNSGISYLPAARLEEGLIPGLTLTEHFILSEKQKGFFVDRKDAEEFTSEKIKNFNIKGTPSHTVESLSGGNQQRALLALMRTPLNLLLLEHPTRGLDIESTMDIWTKLKSRCADGTSILFISSDLDEILHYSDRIIVFFGGKVSKAYDATKITVEQLGQLIGGKGWS
jgi:ABC-type uncharacterized transport system ATPase subunit